MKTSNTTKNKIYVEMMNKLTNVRHKNDIESFIHRNAGLIMNSLNIYSHNCNEDLEDLFQCAMMIMIDAYKKYDKTRGSESTFVWRQLKRLNRDLTYIICKFSGLKRFKAKEIKEIEPCINSLDIYDSSGIYVDEFSKSAFDEIDKRLDNAKAIKMIRKILLADATEDGARRYNILIDTRPYKEIARDYGISYQRVPQIKEKQLNKLSKYFKTRGIEL